MNGGAQCAECGASIPRDSRSGHCGQCLLGLALDGVEGPGAGLPFGDRDINSFGDYQLLEEIARGGMGVVFKARQLSLNRLVAVKFVSAGALATEELVKRFKSEAEAAAILAHPNIVPIYETGEFKGQHFFSMGLVEGPNLRQALSDSSRKDGLRYSVREAADLIATIARAVHYAHQRGVLHRDIKPGNILLDDHDKPHLSDFGLAKLLEKESTLTHTNAVMGTPAYMSPEQARGGSKDVTIAADVYGLGAVLYETLTGSPPFAGGTSMETIRQVLEHEPRRPSILNSKIDRDLETICLKCLEKEPARRYRSAEVLADDLQRWSRHEPIYARSSNLRERFWRWCKRKPALAVAMFCVVFVFAIGAAGVLLALQRAVRGEAAARRHLYDADLNLALQAHQDGNPGRVRELLDKHRPRPGEPDLRGWEYRYLWQQTRSDELFTFGHHADVVAGVAFSPDGKTLLTASADGTAKVWDIATRHAIHSLQHPDDVSAAIFSPDGDLVVTACYDGNVRLWNTSDWNVKRIFAEGDRAVGVSMSPDGRLLAIASVTGVKLRDMASGTILEQWQSTGELLAGTAFSHDGAMLAFNGVDGQIVVWDLENHVQRLALRGHTREVSSVTFSPDGKTLISGGWDNTVRIWDVDSGTERTNLTGFSSWVSCIALSPDGRVLATASTDHKTRLWDTTTWTELATLVGHSDEVWAVAFSPNGAHLATGSKDETIRWWANKPKSANRESIGRFTMPIPAKNWIRPSPDGSAVVTAYRSPSNRIHSLWRSRDLSEVPLSTLPEQTMVVAVAPFAGLFALSQAPNGVHGPILLWHPNEQKVVATLHGEGDGILRAAFSGDGSHLAVGRADTTVEVWNVGKQTLVARFVGPGDIPSKLTFTPNSAALVAAFESGFVVVRDVTPNSH
jgi:eukaryotic-like serine/threonine-protein kinase